MMRARSTDAFADARYVVADGVVVKNRNGPVGRSPDLSTDFDDDLSGRVNDRRRRRNMDLTARLLAIFAIVLAFIAMSGGAWPRG